MSSTPALPAASRRPRLVTPYRLAVSAALAAAAFAAVFAFQSHPEVVPVVRDSAVRAVSPAPGSFNVAQDIIWIEIDPTYSGVIQRIDQTVIPEDQLQIIQNVVRISYNPAQPDSATGRLSAGRHCVVAHFWPNGTQPESGRDYSWCFNSQ
jgi:hypothetical protein